MEPITLGALVAVLFAKALDRAGDEVIDRGLVVVQHGVDALRNRFRDENDEEAQQVLERMVSVPDSARLTQSFAELLDERADRSPALRAELEALVGDARAAGLDINSITQTAIGDGDVQIAHVSNSQIKIENPSVTKSRDPRP